MKGYVPASFSTPTWSSNTKTTEPIFRREGQAVEAELDHPLDTCIPSRKRDTEPPSDQILREQSRTLA